MADVSHRNLTSSDIHEPKGADTAVDGRAYISNGTGGGAWTSGGNLRTLTIEIANLDTNTTYFVVNPFVGTVFNIYSVIHAAIATADAVLTAEINGTGITTGVLTITQSGSAAGDIDKVVPTALNVVADGDTLEIVIASGNTGAARCTVTFVIKVA